MNIYLGENLKQLRLNRRLTQEELANSLGVSFQTISKWENASTYPDITMLPNIALLFGVSVDSLLGVNKVENEQKINEYIELFDTMHFKNTPELLSKYRNAVKEFPNDYRILVRYMDLLIEIYNHPYIKNPDFADIQKADGSETNNPYKLGLMKNPEFEKANKQIMSIYDNIQNHCTDDDIRIWSKRLIISRLMEICAVSFDEKTQKWWCDKDALHKAEEILNTMPAMCNSKELISVGFETSQWNKAHISAIEELLYHLQDTIFGYCYYNDEFTPDYKISIIKHMNGLFGLIENDNYIGKNRIHLIYNYGQLGRLYYQLEDYKSTIKYLKLSAESAKDFDKNPDQAERLFRFYGNGDMFKKMDNMCKRIKALITEHYGFSEEFKCTDEFKDIIDFLER